MLTLHRSSAPPFSIFGELFLRLSPGDGVYPRERTNSGPRLSVIATDEDVTLLGWRHVFEREQANVTLLVDNASETGGHCAGNA
jgi:hypothetical protein